jgi:F0F1-type ATP synthase assembly protein I
MSMGQPPDAALPTEPKAPEKSLGQLFSELTSDLSTLMRKEVELAKVETKEEVSRAGKAGGMLGGGAFAGYFALLFLSFALAWLLDEWMHTALAFLIVGLLYAVVAAVLVVRGRARLQSVNPVPQQTVETLKEDVQWAKAQRS